jgi:hypothetical protein
MSAQPRRICSRYRGRRHDGNAFFCYRKMRGLIDAARALKLFHADSLEERVAFMIP